MVVLMCQNLLWVIIFILEYRQKMSLLNHQVISFLYNMIITTLRIQVFSSVIGITIWLSASVIYLISLQVIQYTLK